jgi:hypothetical protein
MLQFTLSNVLYATGSICFLLGTVNNMRIR